jgi:hypothetical protein
MLFNERLQGDVRERSEGRNTAVGGSGDSNTSLTIAGSDDGLQRGEFTQQNTANDLGTEISPEKYEGIFGHKTAVKCKITVDNKFLQQGKNLKNLGCENFSRK